MTNQLGCKWIQDREWRKSREIAQKYYVTKITKLKREYTEVEPVGPGH